MKFIPLFPPLRLHKARPLTFLCFLAIHLSQLLSMSSHLDSLCLSTSRGTSSSLWMQGRISDVSRQAKALALASPVVHCTLPLYLPFRSADSQCPATDEHKHHRPDTTGASAYSPDVSRDQGHLASLGQRLIVCLCALKSNIPCLRPALVNKPLQWPAC